MDFHELSGFTFENEVRKAILDSGTVLKNIFVESRRLERHTEVDIILITDYKIYCIECKAFRTLIEGKMGETLWIGKTGKYFTRIFNPYLQNTEHVRCVKRHLRYNGYHLDTVDSYVVVRNDCKINTDYRNVVTIGQLASILKRENVINKFRNKEVINRLELVEILRNTVS